jgi:hypothetical protein
LPQTLKASGGGRKASVSDEKEAMVGMDPKQVYSMFPEYNHEIIDLAMDMSGGNESEMIDFLLAFSVAGEHGEEGGAQAEAARVKLTKASPDGAWKTVRCSFLNRSFPSRMLLDPTPARLNLTSVGPMSCIVPSLPS